MNFGKMLGTFLAAWSFLLVAHLTATSAGLIDNAFSAKMEIYCEDSLTLQMQEDYDTCQNPVEAVVVDDTAGMPIVVMLFFGWIIYGALSLGHALGSRREDEESVELSGGT